MKINSIESQRGFNNLQYWQIVYDWEDIIARELGLAVKSRSKVGYYLREMMPWLFGKSDRKLVFDMGTRMRREIPPLRAKSDIIPVIIDFWCNEKQLESFVKAYRNAPLVLVSSREAYDLLKSKNLDVTIEHLPLSLPDYMAEHTPKPFDERKYDLVLAGRSSDMFMSFLKRYQEENPDLKVVTRKWIDNKSVFFDHEGNELVVADTRQAYFDLLNESKAFMYSTPGIDDTKKTNGFSQVTPRFLEALAAGCNMLLRYPDNSDIRFYELQAFGPSISSYDEFKTLFDRAITTPPDLLYYKQYLKSHSTSMVAQQLRNILKRY